MHLSSAKLWAANESAKKIAHCLETAYFSDHRSIPNYLLKRSRLRITIFESILEDLDVSRKNLGERNKLENEAAVQLFIHPIPNTLLSLFHGRLTICPSTF